MLRLVSSQLERGHHTDDKTLAEAAVSFLARWLASSLAPDYPFLNDLKETRNEM